MGGLRKDVCGLHLGTKKNSKQKSLAEHVTCECIIKKKKNQVQIKLVRDMQYKLVDSFIVIINGSSFF